MSEKKLRYWGVHVLHQIFDVALGHVEGGIFYRHSGHGAELGQNAPMIYLTHQKAGGLLGRPPVWGEGTRTDGRQPKRAPATQAYGMDARGRWWSVRYTASGARARTMTGTPYARLRKSPTGKRRRTYIPQLQERAAAELAAATLAQRAARCPFL